MNAGRRCSAILILFALLFIVPHTVLAQAPEEPSGIKKVTSVEGITEYELSNGLQVLLFPDPSKNTITVNVTYRVGSRHEGRGEAGMAHLLEHMVFKGTPTYPNIWGALENHGATFNGTTWVDRTNYFETLPANQENLEFAINMEADRMVNSYIAAEELEREMTVVRNEFERGENSPSSVLSERMMSSAFLWHNYGKSTIGNRSDIERVPADKLREFYTKYYQPDNATLVVAGKFDTDEVLDLIQEKFGNLPRPDRTLDSTYTEEPTQDGARHVLLKRVGDVAMAGLIYHIPSGAHEDFAAIQVLEDTFTAEPSGRLYRQLVSPGKATSVSGVAFSWAEPGVIEFSARVATGEDPEQLLAFMIEIVENAAEDGISDKSVERSKKRLLKSINLGLRNSSRIGVRLSESIALGDWRMMFLHRDRLEQVTADDVRRVAKKYLIASNRTSGLFIPTEEPNRAKIPAAPSVEDLLDGYEGQEQLSAGEEVQPDVAAIERRTIRETLPSGIKVAFLPLEKRGDAAWLSLKAHYGTEEALNGLVMESSLLGMILNRGTKQKSFQELRDAIDSLGSRISAGGSTGELTGSIQSDRENIVASIALLGEILKEPGFDQQEFAIISNMMSSSMKQMKSSPQMLGSLELQRKLTPWPKESIHYVPNIDETIGLIENATMDTIRGIYEQHVGGSHMEIAVVGDFDLEAVRSAIEEQFGNWKSPSKYERIEQPYIEPDFTELEIDTPDKEMAIVGMATSMKMQDTDPDYPSMVMANYVLGGNPKSRLMNRLRHKGGLSYGARSSFSASSQDDRASFRGNAICAPQNAQKAIDAMREEIRNWVDEGLTDEELAEAQKSYALKFESSLGSDQFLLRRLRSGLELDRTLQFNADLVDKIVALSPDDIRSALQKVLGESQMIEVVAGDLAKANAEGSEDDAPPAGEQAGNEPAAAASTSAATR